MHGSFSRHVVRTLPPIVLGVMMLAPVLPGVALARVYKWIDDSGTVHYSDSIPPSESHQRREREVKSNNGQTVDVIEPPPTREELERQRREKAQQEDQRRREEARRREDQNLLMTFQSVDEMKSARDDRLSAIDSQIALIRKRIDKLQETLRSREHEAANLERTGKGDPQPLYQEIRTLKDRIDANQGFIAKQQAEQERIRQKFERDIARFRKLKADGGAASGVGD